MNYGVLVVLSHVVVDENVLNALVERVDPHRLPPADGVGITHPPGGATERRKRFCKKDSMKG